jgi:hypothetical protein
MTIPEGSAMNRRWLMLTAALFVGCNQAQEVEIQYEQPKQIGTDFGRLPSILDGIRKSEEVVLYEGLPSEFWEPQLLEREVNRKKTIRLHGYPFYDERLALKGADAEQFTALFSAERSFKRYRGPKVCGGYHPDYCVEWKTGDAATRALVCLECGEVKIFGLRSELHCDLSPESGKRLSQWLSTYQKNRPAAESRG